MKQFFNKRLFSKILIISLTIFSCSKISETKFTVNPNKLSAKEYQQAGLMHNINLDHILIELIKNGKFENTSFLSRSNNNLIKSNYEQFNLLALAKNISLQQIEVDPIVTNEIKIEMSEFTNNIYQNIPLLGDANLYTASTSSKYSNDQLFYINKLNTIITDSDESIESLHERIEDLESSIYSSNLNQIDQGALYIITNTAKSSLLYWSQNIQIWRDNIKETSLTSTAKATNQISLLSIKPNLANKVSWKRVAKSDIGGAVAGVAAWGGAAFLGGPVTLTAFGISVGGWAAGCSAYEAIMQLW
jgi:hypothetical protein